MNNAELIQKLAGYIEDIESGKIEPRIAQELSNAAGKMVHASKNAIEYQKLKKSGKIDKIAFMED